jgi:hypothetical protein
LALPNFEEPFVLETDACDTGIGVVLMQKGHPIAYLSKALGPKTRAMSTYEKECMAIILALDKWKSYLQHQPFTILIDQRSLTHLEDQKLANGIQHKTFVKLLGLQYKIQYKKGVENSAADGLSRQTHEEEVMAILVSVPRWLETVIEGYQKDDQTKALPTELYLFKTNDKGFSLSDGVIRYKGRMWLGNHKEAHNAVLQALHSSGLGDTVV